MKPSSAFYSIEVSYHILYLKVDAPNNCFEIWIDAATTDIPLSSPAASQSSSSTGAVSASKLMGASSPVQAKLENIKDWSISTFKCTRQLISERLGKSQRTVDIELEAHIESLRDTQRKYLNILRLSRALTSHFQNVVQTQRQLGDAFGEMSQKSPNLLEEFSYNSETQKVLAKNGEVLLGEWRNDVHFGSASGVSCGGVYAINRATFRWFTSGALNFFTSSVNTLCNKTMDDTLLTIKNYETAR